MALPLAGPALLVGQGAAQRPDGAALRTELGIRTAGAAAAAGAALTLKTAAGAQLLETEGRAWSAEHIAAAPAHYGSESDTLCGIMQDSDTASVEVLSRATLSEEDGTAGGKNEDTSITDSGIQRSTAHVYTYVQMLAGGVKVS